MRKPLVSICIPTYNRCKYLQKSIESIVKSKEFLDGKVEIVISDNTSTDDTEELGKKLASSYENIRYFRNPVNIHDENFPLALSRGRGVYRKLSNDTFLYCPGSLAYLCQLVEQYQGTEKVMFFLNGDRKSVKGDRIECSSFDQFVGIAGGVVTWTGGFGLWESECDRVTGDLSGCELQLWQCKRIYEMVASKGEALIMSQKLVVLQYVPGKDLTYNLFRVWYQNLMSILEPYVKSGLLTADTYEAVRRKRLCDLIHTIVSCEVNPKGINVDKSEDLKKLVFDEAKRIGYWPEFYRHYKKGKYIVTLKITVKRVLVWMHLYGAAKNLSVWFHPVKCE